VLLILAVSLEIGIVIVGVIMGRIFFSMPFILVIMIVHLLLFLMSIKGYSKGDFGILCVCQYAFLVVCPGDYLYAVFYTLLSAMLLFVLRNAFRIKKMKNTGRVRMPFTMYIAMGTYISFINLWLKIL